MHRKDNEGIIITVHQSDAQSGIVHSAPCECHDYIQIGANEQDALALVERFLNDLASVHNAINIGCLDCGFEGYVGPGPHTNCTEENKVEVAELTCPECEGKLVDLTEPECDHNAQTLPNFYEEEDLND